MQFTDEEISRCQAAMMKPGPLDALRLIASGRVVGYLDKNMEDFYVDTIDGRKVRDPDSGRAMALAGSWPLFRAGMIDDFGAVTEAGRAHLKSVHIAPPKREEAPE